MTDSVSTSYVEAAARWLPYAERHWHRYPGRAEIGYFGTGTVAIQSLEAVAEHAFVCATLARRPEYDAAVGGLSREMLVERALAGLRYLTETHATGGLECVLGSTGAVGPGGEPAGRGHQRRRKWGGDGWTPVPAFFLSMVADALGEALPEAEAAAVRRVLSFEADANLADQRCTVLEHHGYFREVPPIPTGRFGSSWPESNAWRGTVLAAALLAQPDHPNAARWDDSLKRHFVNALSVPQDASSEVMVDGLPVRERFVGANVHPHFALEHHGFFHPCYAARTMEFMILAARAFEQHGRPAPECTSHHLLDEWQMLRHLILWQGRIAYPAGKDHHRYGWGMTYLLPVVAWLATRDGDAAAAALEEQFAALFLFEQARNGDGAFVRERMGALLESQSGPQLRAGDRSRVLYYRAEADPPFYLLLAQLIHEEAVPGSEFRVPSSRSGDYQPGTRNQELGTFEEPDAGLVLRRDAGRFVSWSWNAHPDVAQGLFVPRDGDHLVEWNGNLAPSFVVLDAGSGRSVSWRRTVTFDGGFATLGAVRLAGGALVQHVLYVALPDGRSAVYADDVRTRWDLTVLHQEGLRLDLGNDLFNGYRRRLRFEGGEVALVAGEAPDPHLARNASRWLVVDDLLGIEFLDESGAAHEPWTIRTFPQRNATDMSAWYATLCRPLRSAPRQFPAGAAVQQTCVRLVANPVGAAWRTVATCRWRTAPEASEPPAPRLEAIVTGFDGVDYRVVADWHRRAVSCVRAG
ncbi:MAG: hypothetical protein HY332_18825 [Chloroflexi bacterium]|nr:hypothetical protein [Chloroflexota bacterium]